MKLSVTVPVGIDGGPSELARIVRDYERAGAEIVWVGEGYGFDVPSTLGYIAAVTERIHVGSSILNAYSRTPALIAQTAAGIDWLTQGRSHLGLGTSGPQVIEGFHGVPFERPVRRISEVVADCRQGWRGERLVHGGAVGALPLPPGAGTGLGKPIKLLQRPVRADIPIWWGSLGQRAVEATAELADGWLTFLLMPDQLRSVWGEALDRGSARRDPSLGQLSIKAGIKVAIGEHLDSTAIHDSLRPMLALYVGGMGARGQNFYNDLAVSYGFEAEAAEIQDLFLDGRRDAAAARVPASWLEAMCVVGPPGHVAERLAAFRAAGVTHLSVDPVAGDAVRTLEQVRALADA
jgi:F420-dependent oxidoreductase-like protein